MLLTRLQRVRSVINKLLVASYPVWGSINFNIKMLYGFRGVPFRSLFQIKVYVFVGFFSHNTLISVTLKGGKGVVYLLLARLGQRRVGGGFCFRPVWAF